MRRVLLLFPEIRWCVRVSTGGHGEEKRRRLARRKEFSRSLFPFHYLDVKCPPQQHHPCVSRAVGPFGREVSRDEPSALGCDTPRFPTLAKLRRVTITTNAAGETAFDALLELSHELGREERRFAILGEGNTSTRLSEGTFAVKASGSQLGALSRPGLAHCRLAPVLDLFQTPNASDDEIEAALLSARVSDEERKPSTEALFHAYLLSLDGVEFVGHTHPEAVNALLASPHAENFAVKRLFPDQIVCCGARSVLVPYVHPGVPLALAIRDGVQEHIAAFGETPRLVLLRNHGLIALGKTPQAVLAGTLMAEKAARVFLGAASVGGPTFMDDENVARIAGWNAEHYRQKVLGL